MAGVSGPDFLCIGLQKSGTTWLYNQLEFLPAVWMLPVKELHYFDAPFPLPKLLDAATLHATDRESLIAQRVRERWRPLDERDARFYAIVAEANPNRPDIEEYKSLFASKGDLLSGDITPGYSTLEESMVEMLAANLPDVKVFMLVRDPVDRAWSQLSTDWFRGQLTDAVLQDDALLTRYLGRNSVRRRSYPSQIATRWERHFGKRFAYFFFQDIVDRPEQLLSEIFHYIGASPQRSSNAYPLDYNRVKKGRRPEFSPRIRAHLEAHFADERRASAELFGGHAREWITTKT